jgi:O-antigen ligase
MLSLLKKHRHTFSEVIFFGMVFLLPLIFNPLGYDMYGMPKNVVLKVGVSLMVLAFIWEAFKKKKWVLFWSEGQRRVLAVFLLILAISWAMAIRPHLSFWGGYFRQGGLINMLHYVVLFVLTLQVLRTKRNQKTFMKVLSLSGLLVAIYAIFQKMGIDVFPTGHTEIFEGRSFSSIGNPTALGAFLLFPIWAEVYLWKMAKAKKKPRHVLGIALMLLALIFSRNRASILALLVTGMLALIHRFRKKKEWLLGAGLLSVIALTVFVQVYGADTRSLGSRVSTWSSSVEILKDNPVRGYGLESFGYVFENYVQNDFFLYEDYHNLVDRPHNEFLEMWIHLGILGAAFYVFVVVYVARAFWRSKFLDLSYVSSLALLSLFVSNFFSFSLTTHYVFVAIFLAILGVGSAKKWVVKRHWSTDVVSIALLLLVVCNSGLAGRFLAADLAIARAYWTADAQHMDRALALAPYYPAVHSEATVFYSGAGDFMKAIQSNAQHLSLTGYDLNSQLLEARLWVVAGDYDGAEAVYQRIHQNNGSNPLLFENWGNLYFDGGRLPEAALIYDELLNSLPTYWAAPILSDGELLREERLFWKNNPDFMMTLSNAVEAYEFVGESEKALEILQALQ